MSFLAWLSVAGCFGHPGVCVMLTTADIAWIEEECAGIIAAAEKPYAEMRGKIRYRDGVERLMYSKTRGCGIVRLGTLKGKEL